MTSVAAELSVTAGQAFAAEGFAPGFGQVTPDWPTGLAAPLSDPPRVVARVRAYLDGAPLERLRGLGEIDRVARQRLGDDVHGPGAALPQGSRLHR